MLILESIDSLDYAISKSIEFTRSARFLSAACKYSSVTLVKAVSHMVSNFLDVEKLQFVFLKYIISKIFVDWNFFK